MARTKTAPLPIPKRMRVGKRNVTVKVQRAKAGLLGYSAGGKMICVYTHDGARPLSAAQVNETFWHELTHTILHAMGKPIKREEQFVTQFAKLLSQAVNTARF